VSSSASEVIYWYFTEVSKLTDQVGVADAELLAVTVAPAEATVDKKVTPAPSLLSVVRTRSISPWSLR
jgi:hypothetical protein